MYAVWEEEAVYHHDFTRVYCKSSLQSDQDEEYLQRNIGPVGMKSSGCKMVG